MLWPFSLIIFSSNHALSQGLLSKIAAYCTDKNNKQQLLSPLLASYEYDENKNLVQSTNQQNETERYAYNAANLLTKRTRASGFSHHFEWDSYSPSAKCIKQWGDNNTYTYQFEYNLEAGEVTAFLTGSLVGNCAKATKAASRVVRSGSLMTPD